MKFLHAALLLTFCLGVRGRESVWEEKCQANAPDKPTALTDLNNSEKNLPKFILKVMEPTSGNATADLHKYCKPDGLTAASELIQDYARHLTDCLSNEEDFLGDFLVTTHGNLLDEFCTPKGFQTMSRFIIGIQSDDYKWAGFGSGLESCVQNTYNYQMIFSEREVRFEKTQFCDDWKSATKCLSNKFAESAVLSEQTASLNSIIKILLRWCNETSNV